MLHFLLYRRFILAALSTLILFLSQSYPLYADTHRYAALLRDLGEKEAEVVHVDDGIAYLNMGDERNINVGELFVLTEEQIIPGMGDHEKPLTVDKKIGIYRVMQAKKDFALIRAVETDREISAGDTVIKNHNLKVAFIDTTGHNESAFIELRNALPNLIWLNYIVDKTAANTKAYSTKTKQQADLFLLADGNAISVRDRDQQLISRYSFAAGAIATEHAQGIKSSVKSVLANQTLDSVGKRLGSVKQRIVASDFIEYKNKEYMLASDGTSLGVYSIANGINAVATLENAFPGTVISVSWWAPDSGASPKAVVSVWKDKQLSYQEVLLESYILSFDQGKLTVERRNIPYLLSAFDLNKDDRKEVLLAQSYSNSNFFGKSIKRVQLSADRILYQALTFDLPRGFAVTGSAIEDLDGDRLDNEPVFESITISDGQLLIGSGDDVKLRRKAGYGGSLVSVLYELDPDLLDTLHETASFEIAPLSVDLNNDGIQEFIVPRVHDKSFDFSFGGGRNYEYRLDAFYLDSNGQFKGAELPVSVFGRIQGMAVFEQQLQLLVSDVESSKTKNAETVLTGYPLSSFVDTRAGGM